MTHYIEVIDNLLDEYHSKVISEVLLGPKEAGAPDFPWLYTNNLNGPSRLGNYYFNNVFIGEGKRFPIVDTYLPFFMPILNALSIDISQVWRLKANLFPRTQFINHHASHVDHPQSDDMFTLLYYVNSNDGFTVIEGKNRWGRKKVKSVRNRLLIFDGGKPHHSTSCTNVNARCSLNFNCKRK